MKKRKVVIVFCEGEAEINLFSFLKSRYLNKKIVFKTSDLGGFGDFKMFIKKYNKRVKEQDLKPKKIFSDVQFLFVIDNDLAESEKIKNFLKAKGHFLQLCDPNTEGMMLAIAKKPQNKFVGDKEYRKKCKDNFKKHFGCEAHKLKGEELKNIFGSEKIFKTSLPVLYKLFKE